MAAAKARETLQPFADRLGQQEAIEAGLLLEGLLRGWDRSTAKSIIDANYEVVDTERELLYTGDFPMKFACRPDQILRHRTSGKLAYLEFKTTSSVKAEWFRQWKRAPQLLATTLAVKETYGEDLDHCIVQPLYKGWKSAERLESCFVYAWRNLTQPQPQWAAKRPTSWKGWDRVRADEIGYPAWLGCIGQEAIDSAIPATAPIFIDPGMVQRWWRQAKVREQEIFGTRDVLADIEEGLTIDDLSNEERQRLRKRRDQELDRYFSQNFRECEPTWGKGCMFLNCCWLDHVGDAPAANGYGWRTPHHEAELGEEAEGV